jgi:hypothetical protein
MLAIVAQENLSFGFLGQEITVPAASIGSQTFLPPMRQMNSIIGRDFQTETAAAFPATRLRYRRQ